MSEVPGFSDHWLALRADADRRARADQLVPILLDGWEGPRLVLDLGAGSGANLRHLAARLGGGQVWTCIDHDPRLLARLPERSADWAQGLGLGFAITADGFEVRGTDWCARVQTRSLDLAPGLAGLDLPPGGLVTASALLDLVAADWLDDLLGRCAAARCRLLFALSYDGRCELAPGRPGDAGLIALVNRHQRGDKGFGPALGPAAADHLERRCAALGYRVAGANSDWTIDDGEPGLLCALLDGWVAAALELAPGQGSALAAWRRQRGADIDAGRLRVRVGHRDLVAVPATGAAKIAGRRSPSLSLSLSLS